MFAPYRMILARPGAVAFSVAGGISRLPMSMVTLSIILLINHISGEYALAGRVAAVYVLVQAVCAPQLAKLIDTYGQSRIMRPSLTIAMVAITGIIVAAREDMPTIVLYALAALAGATIGSMGALVRARWQGIVQSPREMHVAYSFESVVDEFLFALGPMLSTFLATLVSPTAGLAVAIVASGVGGFWFLAQRKTEPKPSGRLAKGVKRNPIISWGLVSVSLVFVTVGMIFGSTDVAVIAVSKEAGVGWMGGIMLGIFAFGSMISGILFGSLDLPGRIWSRFVVGVVGLAIAVSLFSLAMSLPMLSFVMFIAGFGIAPTIISGNAMIAEIVPKERLTEGLTWIGTSLGVGFSFGTSIAGGVADASGGHTTFYVVMAAAGCALVIALLSVPVFRRSAAQTGGDHG